MANLIEDLWNGYVLHEGLKVQQRLGSTATQQQAWNTAPVSSNPQAKNAELQTKPGGLTSKQWLIAGGILAAGALAYFALK